MEVEDDDPLGLTSVSIGGPVFALERPYLNPKKKFKEEEIKLAVFSNTSLSFSVEGGGKGWYAKFLDKTYSHKSFLVSFAVDSIILFSAAYLVGASDSKIVDNMGSLIVIVASITMFVIGGIYISNVLKKAIEPS